MTDRVTTARQRAVVTGAASGLGQALVRTLLDHGGEVQGLDRQTTGRPGDAIIDLSDQEALASYAEGAPPWSALYHAAGVGPDLPPALILAVNLLAPVHLTRLMTPKALPGASVLSIASVAATLSDLSADRLEEAAALEPDQLDAFVTREGLDGPGAYRLSKAALLSWSTAQAVQSQTIRFNCVSPGPIRTPLWDRARAESPGPAARFLDLVPYVPTPEEIAPSIAALGSPAFCWVNGAEIPLDGGLRARLAAQRAD